MAATTYTAKTDQVSVVGSHGDEAEVLIALGEAFKKLSETHTYAYLTALNASYDDYGNFDRIDMIVEVHDAE